MPTQPLLSIGMIVKNESRCLEKCLKALEPLRNAIPCELVIADTGSTDNTKEIASRYADTLFDFTWVNDFSKARNAVMDRCKGNWFLSLDADEYLQSAPTELVNLVTEKYKGANHGFIIIRDFSSTTLTGIYSDFSALRITRLNEKVRFVNTIHERLDISDINTAISLSNTIFAHDGYADSDSEFVKNKMKRNLELLEQEYEKRTDDTSIILQLLESCHIDNQLKVKYSKTAMEHIQKLDKTSPEFIYLAPAIARKAIQYAVKENYIEAEDWFNFAKNNFKDSLFYLIDITYLKIQWHIDKSEYDKAILISKEYFCNIETLKKSENQTKETWFSSIKFSHKINQSSALLLIANAYIKLKKENDAYNCLEKIELTAITPLLLHQWLSTIKLLNVDTTKKLIKKSLTPVFSEKESTSPEKIELYNYLTEYIRNEFSYQNANSNIYKIYTELDNTVGICAKILDSDDKATVEKLFNSISDYTELLPLALCKIISLNLNLPTGFLNIPLETQKKLLKNITTNNKQLLNSIINYTTPENLSTFNEFSFAFNLISAVSYSIDKDNCDFYQELKSRFYEISRIFLTNLYHPEILENDDVFCTLPALHRFSIYYIMAIDTDDFREKVGFLRQALKEEPEMKNLISFTLEEIKKEHEHLEAKKQFEDSPELLELAKNIKTLLNNYPANSPELLAIKQSPVYKQVAHLIENQ